MCLGILNIHMVYIMTIADMFINDLSYSLQKLNYVILSCLLQMMLTSLKTAKTALIDFFSFPKQTWKTHVFGIPWVRLCRFLRNLKKELKIVHHIYIFLQQCTSPLCSDYWTTPTIFSYWQVSPSVSQTGEIRESLRERVTRTHMWTRARATV